MGAKSEPFKWRAAAAAERRRTSPAAPSGHQDQVIKERKGKDSRRLGCRQRGKKKKKRKTVDEGKKRESDGK